MPENTLSKTRPRGRHASTPTSTTRLRCLVVVVVAVAVAVAVVVHSLTHCIIIVVVVVIAVVAVSLVMPCRAVPYHTNKHETKPNETTFSENSSRRSPAPVWGSNRSSFRPTRPSRASRERNTSLPTFRGTPGISSTGSFTESTGTKNSAPFVVAAAAPTTKTGESTIVLPWRDGIQCNAIQCITEPSETVQFYGLAHALDNSFCGKKSITNAHAHKRRGESRRNRCQRDRIVSLSLVGFFVGDAVCRHTCQPRAAVSFFWHPRE